MKKILIAHDLHALLKDSRDFKDWQDVRLFVSASNDEALQIHRSEQVNLIITELEMPGMSIEEFCSTIRGDAGLRKVSIIMICANNVDAVERSLRCRTNAVLLRPVHPLVLTTKARQLVDVPERETYRALLSASLKGRPQERFFCRSRNISAAGVLIETDKQLVEGARLSCSFLLPESREVVHVSAKVVRMIEQARPEDGHQYGLMFTDIPPRVKQMLAEYVQKKASDHS